MALRIVLATAVILGVLNTSAYPAEDINLPVSTASAKLMDKFDAGDYWSVGSDGEVLLTKEPGNDELRMRVADSLAWTGRYAEAISQYQMLADTTLSDRAALGLANVYRWSGRPDLASPLYQKVLASRPDDPDALDGLNRVNRMLRPRTDITLVRQSDSNLVEQNGTEIKHSWRGDNLAINHELSLNTSRYTLSPLVTRQTEINFGIEHTGLALAPKLDLSLQQKPIGKAFASLRLRLDDAPELHLTLGHVNWGNMAFQPKALLAGLVATQLGADGSLITRPGTISAIYNDYRVSDGNEVQDANIKFSPSWRPLGVDFRYFIGLTGRSAQRNVPTYWSPETGYLSADIGFTDEWSLSTGDYSICGQRGFGVGGEALNSYNIGFAAKRYFERDWAASLSAGMLKNQRADAYHSKYLTLAVERLW